MLRAKAGRAAWEWRRSWRWRWRRGRGPRQRRTPRTPPASSSSRRRSAPSSCKHCYSCHSAEAKKLKGGLLLDSKAGILKGGDSGPALVPGKPGESLLIKALRHLSDDLKMPPKGKLADEVIADFAKWIDMGAPDPRDGKPSPAPSGSSTSRRAGKFWSFQPLAAPTPPPVKNQAWARTPIDRFILAKLEEKKLRPNGRRRQARS